ncbi:hypothetical protein L596_019048 [Steinernema carpocapsae]|uniref:Uncharacterized protein n=2 Tax=Steinernema carpocapsae TaxID=34508 RepID=A0A4U5N706_STECR|nr:hypothetical protein L596_019048 [Steinernema carpocapsae]
MCLCSKTNFGLTVVTKYNSLKMMKQITLLAIFIAFCAAAEVTLEDATTTKDGAEWCPVPLAGTRCPSGSIFHYYKCCGNLNSDCCFNLQVWVIIVLVVVAVILLASFVMSILRCVFCRR